jgi:hypothetical protein
MVSSDTRPTQYCLKYPAKTSDAVCGSRPIKKLVKIAFIVTHDPSYPQVKIHSALSPFSIHRFPKSTYCNREI